MRKYIFILIGLAAAVAMSLSSCRRVSDNGKIDGFWQIREIRYNSGETSNPDNLFIAVNLELMQLDDPGTHNETTGVISYHKGADKIGVDFRNRPSAETLAKYGFATTGPDTNVCVLEINRLDSKYLVMTSPIAVITCKRY